MLQFCPNCGNLLGIEEGENCLRFSCHTCPYIFNIVRKVSSRIYPILKVSEHVVRMAEADEIVWVAT